MDSIANQLMVWAYSLRLIDAGEILFVTMAVIGQHFITGRHVRGFYFWLPGNLVAIWVFYESGHWVTVALYVYYAVQCVKGIFAWRKLDRAEAAKQVPVSHAPPSPEIQPEQALRSDAVALGLA